MNKIREYELAIAKEVATKKEYHTLQTMQEEYFALYNAKCAEIINKHLQEIGSEKRYDTNKYSCTEYFIVDAFEEGSKEQLELIDFCEKNVPLPECEDISDYFPYFSYEAFMRLNMPLNLKRSDFSSEEIFKKYNEHVFSATHDFD